MSSIKHKFSEILDEEGKRANHDYLQIRYYGKEMGIERKWKIMA